MLVMANAEIVPIGMNEIPIIVDLYNEVFRPGQDATFFERRLARRYNALILLAQINQRPVGFAMGFEVKPSTFYCWYIGVLKDYRRAGVASQLMEAMTAWARENGYRVIRFECYNHNRPMLHLAIRQNYHIVGVRYDSDAQDNLITMELAIEDELED
jgi:ribosomal protein S18 acetylase RimI-like enzyme